MKNIIALGLIVVAVALVIYTVVHTSRRNRGKIVVQEEFAAGQVSQEVFCDNCRAISGGQKIGRAHSQQYQVCPACKQKKARPIVYFYCQNPGCNKALVKVRNVVVEDHQVLPGDTPVCPVCGREDTLTPMEIELSTAQRIAKETGQQFP
jgi:RNA polymerase subunit RPABC4/transcription elongation factor Spt4